MGCVPSDMNSTNFCFKPGYLTILMDGGSGSSGKGKLGSYVAENADNLTFMCNCYAPQAGHTVVKRSGLRYFYQTLNSAAYLAAERDLDIYLGPGSVIEVKALLREIEESNVPAHLLHISPVAVVLTEDDRLFEEGKVDFQGVPCEHDGTIKSGSTCLSADSLVETDRGLMTIKQIVDSRFRGSVMSYDSAGNPSLRQVVNHWSASLARSGKKWVRVVPTNHKAGTLLCTSDHLCATLVNTNAPDCLAHNNLMFPTGIKFVKAEDMAGQYAVRHPKRTANNLNDNKLYNGEQMAALIGTMLGDSTIHKQSYPTCDHGQKQVEYIELKAALFGGDLKPSKSGWNPDDHPTRLTCEGNGQTKCLYKLMYGADGKKSPVRVLNLVNEIGLAFWYMDDGTLTQRKGKKPTATICTDSYTRHDNEHICKWLKHRWGIDASVSYRNRIAMTVAGSVRLFECIDKYVHSSMRYKLPRQYHDRSNYQFDCQRLPYAASLVEKVVAAPDCRSKLYDIEVAGNHTFVANRTVVHNCHGVGAANARRVLRQPGIRLAKDTPELAPFIQQGIPDIIQGRLDDGQAGLLEIAQGYQLSMMHERFFPFTTSRNCTVAQGLSDMMVAPKYAGPVIINFRTYPIRIHSKKYLGESGKFLTWAEVQAGMPHKVIESPSGPWYEDQKELTWDQVTALSGSPTQILETTSVTKLPRRVANWSYENLVDAIRHNDCGHGVLVSVNFLNYVDHAVEGATQWDQLSTKAKAWVSDSLRDHARKLAFLGTGAATEDCVLIR